MGGGGINVFCVSLETSCDVNNMSSSLYILSKPSLFSPIPQHTHEPRKRNSLSINRCNITFMYNPIYMMKQSAKTWRQNKKNVNLNIIYQSGDFATCVDLWVRFVVRRWNINGSKQSGCATHLILAERLWALLMANTWFCSLSFSFFSEVKKIL